MTKKVYITGATGCIGHYILDQLKGREDLELHLLCRDPKRLKFDYQSYANIQIQIGNLEHIEEQESVIKEMDYIIHIATDWSNSDYACLLNVEKTNKLFNYTDPEKLQKIVYFSTASILGPGSKPVPQAGEYGSGYVRSKYMAHASLENSPRKDKIVTVFPTLVFGGDPDHPYSHISSGLKPNLHFIKWLRFVYLDGAFHFLHSKDIASVAVHCLFNDVDKNEYVLGVPRIDLKEAIKAICKVFNMKVWFQIKIPVSFIKAVAKILRIEIGPWEHYCMDNPYMVYDTVTPSHFGLDTAFPTMESVLEDIKKQPE